ncbi:hypothetical protein Tco_1113581 [Tanacetum coccineum]|uniref:Uncharacterized protein n=1 Tax=Tanacetum coccineum TaxID=301880 RepID=A0ABQ5IVL2_9ASTR
MPSSPSSPHRHHHLLVIIPTPPLPSSPPRTVTSTHAKHHRDNLLEGASGGGNSTEVESAWGCGSDLGRVRLVVKPPEKGAFVVGQPPPEEAYKGAFGLTAHPQGCVGLAVTAHGCIWFDIDTT